MTDEAPQGGDARRSRTVLIALLAGVVLVVVVALIVVFARGGPSRYAEDTPEGVVQRYTQAVIDGDIQTALTHLVPAVADECERTPPSADDSRVTWARTTERGGAVRVDVIVTTVYGSGPLGPSEYRSDEYFDLVEVDGVWRIDTAPWQFVVCLNGGYR